MAGVAKSDKKRAHFTIIWKIEHFIGPFINIYSPMFTIQSMEMTEWKLGFYATEIGEFILQLWRLPDDEGPHSIEVDFEFSILDNNGCSIIQKSSTGHFQKHTNSTIVFLKKDAIFDKRGGDSWPKDTLTVRCCIWRKGTEITKHELCFASTEHERYKRSCVWAVKGFSSLQKGEKRIRTLKTAEKGCPQLILTLSLEEKNKGECVFIHMEATVDKLFRVYAKISLLDAEGKVFPVEMHRHILCKNGKYFLGSFEKNKLLSDKTALLSDDALLLRCEFQLTFSDLVRNIIEDYKLMDYPDSKLAQEEKSNMNIEELNETSVCPFKEIIRNYKADGDLCDISLRIGTKSFPAHKLILSSRSPVFKAMFTRDMKEKTSKCIDIPDLDADTLGHLLLYMYENTVTELTCETAANLYEAADKYEVLDLKEKCSHFLKSNFLKSNVCKILVLADMHQDESLRKSAQDFIRNNPEIVFSQDWKVFRNNHSELAWEIAEQVIGNMKPSKS